MSDSNTNPGANPELSALREKIRSATLASEQHCIQQMMKSLAPEEAERAQISDYAVALVEGVRQSGQIGLMEIFLAEYGLSSDEGVALMCLAEALLRVPDDETIDELIEDKIAPSSWGQHLGRSSSSLVNASTWALMLTGKVLDDEQSEGIAGVLRSAIKRVGEPVIRTAVKRAMKELGKQFVLGQTIDDAIHEGQSARAAGYLYSYDMLGEAAVTMEDAQAFYKAYQQAITALAQHCKGGQPKDNPGISIKLSALHPRYEVAQRHRVMQELLPRSKALALLAKNAGMGLNIDAEEADRLDLSLDIIEALLRDPDLAGWQGFGVVVQAYGRRCAAVLDWLYALSTSVDRKIMVRLVKGAYWDSEIKRAQVEGLHDFPVFTRKANTDISYICCGKKLLGMSDRIFPQFATHNAHTVSAILQMASQGQDFEFQRLHGMGEALHQIVLEKHQSRCRIYAPVGPHRDLLAYLVRRLLENGANSSFVNQIVDATVSPQTICADPFAVAESAEQGATATLRKSTDLYMPERKNSRGWDLTDMLDIDDIDKARGSFKTTQWQVSPLLAAEAVGQPGDAICNPAHSSDVVATVTVASAQDVETALSLAQSWEQVGTAERALVLQQAADLYEANYGEIFAVLCREAGKTPRDAIAEVREAVDFLRYYAAQAQRHAGASACGIFVCISPWNFPLAIFSGQIAAALAAGNAVIAKPAEATPVIASLAVKLLHKAGVPRTALQLLPGPGSVVGAMLSSDPRCCGVCFTGSTATAMHINKAMAEAVEPAAPLIAETGGLNAMIVDSTALPEQAVRDIVVSAFQSAGQRCSALRILCLQEDIEPAFIQMLIGAMQELTVGDPWSLATDTGPVITEAAQRDIQAHIDRARDSGSLVRQITVPQSGNFIGPALIRLQNLAELQEEVFGPVLHYITFSAEQLEQLTEDINATGYGLTFGLHSRIDDRVELLTSRLKMGNMYINRNQIGAIVGSQPFGGEGLSGTGPKAGGPHYLPRFFKAVQLQHQAVEGRKLLGADIQPSIDKLPAPSKQALHSTELPGPTGESNRLGLYARGVILCLGPSADDARRQAYIARSNGCAALCVAPGAEAGGLCIDGVLERSELTTVSGIDAVALWGDSADQRRARQALAARSGPIIPLLTMQNMHQHCLLERHVCIDTTAAGGNASLLASSA